MPRFYTYLYENDITNGYTAVYPKTEMLVKEEELKKQPEFCSRSDPFIGLIYKGDIKKGLKKSKRLNIWTKKNDYTLQGYKKTSGKKNIFKAISQNNEYQWKQKKAQDFMEVMVKFGRTKEIVEIVDPNAVDLAVQKFTINDLILKPF